MPNALQKLQAGADKVGRKLAAKGFREYTVSLRTVTRPDKDPLMGTKGTATAAPDVVIEPPPEVENVSLRAIEHGAGLIQSGDIRISGISRSTAFEALIKDPKTIWLVTGPDVNGEYGRIDGSEPKAEDTEWVVTVRPLPEK